MKSERKIFVAFLLNFCFSIINVVGGILTGSFAILSDAVHDFGDSLSIGTSFVFEKISKKKPNDKYTYGYYRYSVLGSVIQSVILLCGSIFVIYNAVLRLINPSVIDYNGMIIIAIIGFIVNFVAAYITSEGNSLNQKAINLHMIEDVLGWAIVLVGAALMYFTNWVILDAILSIGLAIFIVINAIKGLKIVLDIFLEKTPGNVNVNELKNHLLKIEGVEDVHHIHVWSMDGYNNSATLHVVSSQDFYLTKEKVREELKEHGIAHVTIECESVGEKCHENHCAPIVSEEGHGHHHHHHHHHHGHTKNHHCH